MIGLILKDFLVLQKLMRSQIPILIAMTILFTFSFKSSTYTLAVVCVFLLASSVNVFYYDDAAKWDSFAQTLPIKKKTIVEARYWSSLITILGGLLVVTILKLISKFFVPYSKNDIPFVPVLCVTMFLVFLMYSILFPIIYRFGPEHSRVISIAVIMIPVLIFILLGKSGALDNLFTSLESSGIESMIPIYCYLSIPAGIVLLLLSCMLSIRIYNQKEC
jgi:ABC-2 type transport system permease protein